jgi:hypothetical protein
MISREDVVSAIGYDGNAALVDHFAKRRYGKLSTEELAKAGFFRAAAASAIWSGSQEELALVADYYNRASGASYPPESIPRLFGVGKVTVPRALRL